MSTTPHDAGLDNRANDANVDRLRDGAAHFIDVVRQLVRAELDAGNHPGDAIGTGVSMMEWYEAGINRSAPRPAAAYTADIESALDRLRARIGAENMFQWLRRERGDDLHGRSPLRCIVGHDLRSVRRLIDAMPEPEVTASSDAQAGSGAEGAEEGRPPAGVLTTDEYGALAQAGVLSKVELIEGRVVMGEYELVFSPSQTAAAERLGVRVRSCVDAVLEYPALRAQVLDAIRQRSE
jgi:hypothetical protein